MLICYYIYLIPAIPYVLAGNGSDGSSADGPAAHLVQIRASMLSPTHMYQRRSPSTMHSQPSTCLNAPEFTAHSSSHDRIEYAWTARAVDQTCGLTADSTALAIMETEETSLPCPPANGEEAPEMASVQSLRTRCKNPRIRRLQKQSLRKPAAHVRHAIGSADTGIASPPSERPMEWANFVEIADDELVPLRTIADDELVPLRTPRLASASAFSTAAWPRTYHRDCFWA